MLTGCGKFYFVSCVRCTPIMIRWRTFGIPRRVITMNHCRIFRNLAISILRTSMDDIHLHKEATMVRNHRVTLYLSDQELEQVQARANRELIDARMWMRRVAVSIANGTAKVVASERGGLHHAV